MINTQPKIQQQTNDCSVVPALFESENNKMHRVYTIHDKAGLTNPDFSKRLSRQYAGKMDAIAGMKTYREAHCVISWIVVNNIPRDPQVEFEYHRKDIDS